MNPFVVSARYAAYVWFVNQPENVDKTRKEGLKYARKHWHRFAGCAHEGWGQLIINVTAPLKEARNRLRSAELTPSMPQ